MALRTVVVIQRRLTAYRVPLFEGMRERLAQQEIRLRVLHGEPHPSERSKSDGGELPWAERLPTTYLTEKLCWQPYGSQIKGADLVIVTHENRQLYNFLALTIRRPGRIAFWGHGRNFQSDSFDSLPEKIRRRTLRLADWWFAYTDTTAAVLRSGGFPESRITVVDNATDTRQLRAEIADVSPQEIEEVRESLGLTDGLTAVYLGSLYSHKRLDFLLESADRIRREVPQFSLLVIGDGPDRNTIGEAGQTRPWLKYVGYRRGRELARLLCAADICLNPGATGLGMLDAFCVGLPYVTTEIESHGPEIAYLVHGENGLMTADSPHSYSEAVVRLLGDGPGMSRMRAGAHHTATTRTIERMTDRFCGGILECLAVSGSRPPADTQPFAAPEFDANQPADRNERLSG